jgi:hypothetical protein
MLNIKLQCNQNYIDSVKNEFKIQIQASINSSIKFNTKLKSLEDSLASQPILLVYYQEERVSITSEPNISNSNPTQSSCKRNSFRISFKELGWDNFIIEPKYLDSYYCDGKSNNFYFKQ